MITVNLDTSRFGGKRLKEVIAIQTNDPKHSMFNLTIEGDVETFVTIDPTKAMLLGAPGDEIKASVKIIPEANHPFKIIEAKAEKGKYIRYRLGELKGSGKAGYVLSVKNIKKERGRYVDTIYLTTTSKIGPVIKILVWGNIK